MEITRRSSEGTVPAFTELHLHSSLPQSANRARRSLERLRPILVQEHAYLDTALHGLHQGLNDLAMSQHEGGDSQPRLRHADRVEPHLRALVAGEH